MQAGGRAVPRSRNAHVGRTSRVRADPQGAADAGTCCPHVRQEECCTCVGGRRRPRRDLESSGRARAGWRGGSQMESPRADTEPPSRARKG